MSQLTAGRISKLLDDQSRACLDKLEVFAEIGSTNGYLIGKERPAPGRCRVAIAEYQSSGRGRGDRVWVSPPSTGLCMSMAFTFEDAPRQLPSLSLAIGIGVVQALERLGIHGIRLKWPNDLVAGGGKLGGILSEVHPAKGKGVTVVVGIGLNIDLRNSEPAREIVTSLGRASDLASCCAEPPSRARISAAIIEALAATLARFATAGFAPFHALWPKYDWLRGQEVTVASANASNIGIAEGVDTDGALLLNAGGNLRRITSGSVIFGERTGAHP